MGLKEQDRREVVAYRIERAFVALEQAKINQQHHCLEVVANRLYYAAYYAATALLIADGIRTHSHDGAIGQFGQYYVKTGQFSKETGRFLRQLFQMRLTGDYDDYFGLTEEDVFPKIQPTEAFIKEVTNLAKAKLGL